MLLKHSICVLSIIFLTSSCLNYSGFCFSKMRYLSKNEKIKSIFNHLNNSKGLRVKIADKGYQYRKHLKYESFEEYLKKYPDCCTLHPPAPGGSDLPPPSFIDRISGYHSGRFVRIKFVVRYLDDDGILQYQKITSDKSLKNCGGSANFN